MRDSISLAAAVVPVSAPLIFPASFGQQRLWFLDQAEPESALYNIPVRVRLRGVLNTVALQESLKEILRRHEVLRTIFAYQNESVVQVVKDEITLAFEILDLTNLPEKEQTERVQTEAQVESEESFDLAQGPLLRGRLLHLAEQEHVLLLTMHHIVSDGWSTNVLMAELSQLYEAFSKGRRSPLEELPIQYADFAISQREWMQGEVLQEQLEYWKNKLEELDVSEVPADFPRKAENEPHGASEQFCLPSSLTSQLKQLARTRGTTLYVVLLAGFQVLLSRFSGQTDIAVGTPIAGRRQTELEKLIGFFVNNLVMRTDLGSDPSVDQLLSSVQETVREAFDHQDVPFELLVDALQPERRLGQQPLFQAMFVLQNVPRHETASVDLTLEELPIPTSSAKFDLSLFLHERVHTIEGSLHYRTGLYHPSTIRRLLDCYQRALQGIVADKYARISELELLSQKERECLLFRWNNTERSYPQEKCIHELIEEQVERTPEAPAIILHDRRISYRQINAKANQLAHYLRKLGVGPEERVGIYVPRSEEMLIGVLGTLKSGAAYVPFDPEYPVQRLAFMVGDANVSILLTTQALRDRFASFSGKLIILEQQWQAIAHESTNNPPNIALPANMAYVIYTSGSTGKPKGVQLQHQGLVNLVTAPENLSSINSNDILLQFSSLSFDASIWEIATAWTKGASLYVNSSEKLLAGQELAEVVEQAGITAALLPPSALYGIRPEAMPGVSTLVVGGEATSEQMANQWSVACTFINAYGPTESTVWITCFNATNKRGRPPIGTPIANSRVYVLGKSMELLPVGTPGELYIASDGLARGYLNRPELTAERFVPNPFSQVGGDRLYRTGDLLRWKPEGVLEYLNRIDHQVKVRGYRIELGEITAALENHPSIERALAVVREDQPGEKRLVGYFEVKSGADMPASTQLRAHLKQFLPDYMVPGVLVQLQSFPLSTNGKIDRKALPTPELLTERQEYTEPENHIQKTLCAIWARVLGLKQIGIHENFFELGGDSILSLQVVARAREAELVLSSRQIFTHQTVAELSQVVTTNATDSNQTDVALGRVPLTPIQTEFFTRKLAVPDHYNQSLLLSLNTDVSSQLLERAVSKLVVQHDALKMQYHRNEQGEWEQWCKEALLAGIYERKNISGIAEPEQLLEGYCQEIQGSLNLRAGRLFRAVEFDLGEKGRRLLLVAHHLVVDGVSWRILLEDLERGYEQLRSGKNIDLGPKSSSFRLWSERLQQYANSLDGAAEVFCWRDERWQPSQDLPRDFKGNGSDQNTVEAQRTVTIMLPEQETRELLLNASRKYHAQIQDILLAALWRTVSSWSGSISILVDLEGHGREDLFSGVDVSRTVGWFTTFYPVLLGMPDAWDPARALKTIKEQLRQVSRHGFSYGLLKTFQRDEVLMGLPRPEIAFNYLGQFDQLFRQSHVFSPAKESHGSGQAKENQRHYLLDVGGMIVEGRLRMTWGYSHSVHQKNTIERLAENYLECLCELITDCKTGAAGGYTPSDFPLTALTQAELDHYIGPGEGIETIYGLSPMQQGLLFHSIYDPDGGFYFNQLGCRIEDLNVAAFKLAWTHVVRRHPILRTSFLWEGLNDAVQIVWKDVELLWREEDWRELGPAEQEQKWANFLHDDRRRSFDLTSAPVLRLSLIRSEERSFYFCWSTHHVVMDGWCRQIVIGEVFTLYENYRNGQTPDLPKIAEFQNYIAWLREQSISDAEKFWRRELQGFTNPTRLWVERENRHKETTYLHQALKLRPELTKQLGELARQQQVTPNTIVQGAWALLLSHYATSSDVVFGTTVSGRSAPIKDIESMVGLFINTLPSRIQIDKQLTITDYLKNVQEKQAKAREYEYSPLSRIAEWSEVPRGTALFRYILVFENFPVDVAVRTRAASILKVGEVRNFELSHYTMTLAVGLQGEMSFSCTHDTRRLPAPDVHRLLLKLEFLLTQITARPQMELRDLSLLNAAERDQLLVEWNRSETAYPHNRCLHELFEEQALRTPNATALKFNDEQLSYSGLNGRANRLARYLREMGVGPEVHVGICMERSCDAIVAMLAVMKSGGAYVPLDPTYPRERLNYICEDSRLHLVLTTRPLGILGHGEILVPEICLQEHTGEIARQDDTNLTSLAHPANLAYLIYTSGSTGTPKGVMIAHYSIVNRVWWAATSFLDESDAFLQKTAFSFDASIWEIFAPLLVGARIVLAKPGGQQDSGYLAEVVHKENITALQLVPSMFEVFSREPELSRCAGTLKRMFCGGEALSSDLVERFRQTMSQTTVIDLYGPTEASIDVSSWTYQAAEESTYVPLGRPISNIKLYILNEDLQPVPVGVAGEIHASGAGLARGYWQRSTLTGEKFIPDPFSGIAGERLYKTGDLGRYRADSAIEYLGRIDGQVKVRGYRIELGEIEVALQEHEAVTQAAVIAREDVPGRKRIVAYVVRKSSDQGSPEELLSYLKQQLPEYMVPSLIVELPEMLVLPSGKIDRKRLPALDRTDSGQLYSGPRNEIEETFVRIWSELLKVDRIGIHDSFFTLGGDSILSLQVVSRAREAGVFITPKQVFEYQTIAQLAALAGQPNSIPAEQGLVKGSVPLTPIQSAFFGRKIARPEHYNQSLLLRVNPSVSSHNLRHAVEKLFLQHDALRMKYIRSAAGEWEQWCAEAVPEGIYECCDLSGLDESEQSTELRARAELAQSTLELGSRLVKVVEFDLGINRGKQLLIVIHHLLVDGVSWRILLHDLDRACRQLRRGEKVALGRKTTSYRQWAEALREYCASEETQKEIEYWMNVVSEQVRPFPIDYPDGLPEQNTASSCETVSLSLSKEETRDLLENVHWAYHTRINDVLLTALYQTIAGWGGSERVLIDLEGHGRGAPFAGIDLSTTVGWFTTVYPVALQAKAGSARTLKTIKEQLRGVPEDGFRFSLLRELSPDDQVRSCLKKTQAEISFNYLGQFDHTLTEESLFSLVHENHGREQAGQNQRQYLLEVSGMVVQQSLRVSWTYSEKLHKHGTVEKLARSYMDGLREIIAHCRQCRMPAYTPSDFPLAHLDQDELDICTGGIQRLEDIYMLSPMQEGMLFHSLYNSQSSAYFSQLSYVIEDGLDVVAFRKAWTTALERHAILRTAFVWQMTKTPIQVVYSDLELPWRQEDWRGTTQEEQEQRWKEFLKEDRDRGFDLAEPPQFRLMLARTGETSYYFSCSHHHALMDGWSYQILTNEVFSLYQTYRNRRELGLQAPNSYKSYIGWLQTRGKREAELFWRQELRDFSGWNTLGLETEQERANRQESDFKLAEMRFSEDLTSALQNLASLRQITLNAVVQGAWALLLSRYNGRNDVLFGATVSGRSAAVPGIEMMIGLFINTLPVRVQIDHGETAGSYLKQIQKQQAEAREHEYAPLVDIQRWSGIPAGSSLFDHILVYENYPIDSSIRAQSASSLRIKGMQVFNQTHYSLTVRIVPGAQLSVRCAYHHLRFGSSAITRVLRHLELILESFSRNTELPLAAISLMTEEERHQVLQEWNRTASTYPADCIHELFEQQALKTPSTVALECEGRKTSYRELNERVANLARYLRGRGVGPEIRVGICLQRTEELIVALLAVLKSGGAYVPLDPAYPNERLLYMLQDSAASLLLTHCTLAGRWNQASIEALCVDQHAGLTDGQNGGSVHSGVCPENLAYLLYTSGSTGQPKGVAIQHRSLVNYIWWARHYVNAGLGHSTVEQKSLDFALYSSISFDLTVTSIFTPLISGGCIHLYPGERDHKDLIQTVIEDGRCQVVKLTPGHLKIAQLSPTNRVQQLIVGGEALYTELAGHIMKESSRDIVIWNEYGPTEITVACSLHRYDPECDRRTVVPIGRPGANAQIFILDENLEPVPVGLIGEIYIGGAGLARGYHNKSEFTAERFLPNPFSAKAGERFYRSGDQARYLENGEIEYLGRGDQQVKFRGYRVELSEIRAVLNSHPEVKDSVIVVEKEDNGHDVMVAYYVAEREQDIKILREHMEGRLIRETIPNLFLHLPELPLTANGKLDLKALPTVKDVRKKMGADARPAEFRSPVEELLSGIWSQVLQIDRVTSHDNFFELGGHSLLATQVISRIRTVFEIELPLRAVFESPTLSELAKRVEAVKHKDASLATSTIKHAIHDGPIPLSYAQQRLWFIQQLQSGSGLYNISVALHLLGELEVAAFQAAIREIIRRHDILRTTFKYDGERPVQLVNKQVDFEIEQRDFTSLPESQRDLLLSEVIKQEADYEFKLEEGPLFRINLVRLAEKEWAMMAVMHHIISDAWSFNVLVKELSYLYKVYARGEAPLLTDPPLQYADYTIWQHEWLSGEVLKRQLNYWKKQLTGLEQLELPTDYPRPPVADHRGAIMECRLSLELEARLKELGLRHGTTLFMTTLAAFQILLSRYSGQRDIAVGTPIAGRNSHQQLEELIGFFVNTLVMRTDLSGNPTVKAVLAAVREMTLDASTFQDLPFDRIVDELQLDRTLAHSPLFQVMFILQNAPRDALVMERVKVEQSLGAQTWAKFDLTLTLQESAPGLVASMQYRRDLYEDSTIRRSLRHYVNVLEAITADSNCRLSDIPLLDGAEREQILQEWNRTELVCPAQCFHELFEQQAQQTPHATALEYKGQKLTYRELNCRTNRLARYLRKLGVRPEARVGICIERSLEMVVGVISIMKAGGLYVPLDPTYPPERLAFMMEDGKVGVLLTQQRLLSQVLATNAVIVRIDAEEEAIDQESSAPVENLTCAENLAYMIYTSGSTGKPKGVQIPHSALTNLLNSVVLKPGIGAGDVFLAGTSLSFDIAGLEIYTPLITGAQVTILSEEAIFNRSVLLEEIGTRASIMQATPTIWSLLIEAGWKGASGLKVLCGGEVMSADLASKLTSCAASVWNMYGPTETTIWSLAGKIRGKNTQISIGRPIANTQAYLLDEWFGPVPPGVAAELYIAGAGVARGYFERPVATAEKFIPNPFSRSGDRMYRTGDLARYNPDGTLQFIGRIDHQVKIHGYRIELGEIESALLEYEGVEQAVAIVREDSPAEKQLVAYIVCSGENVLDKDELRVFLKKHLPGYMVPIVQIIERIPLTPNGKIDRKALPRPEMHADDGEYHGPRNAAEEILCGICSEALRLSRRVGIHENFFGLGGDSISAIQVITRAQEAGLNLKARQIFTAQTVAELAALQGHEMQDVTGPILVPLRSAGSRRPLFFIHPSGGGINYLWPLVRRLDSGQPVYAIRSGGLNDSSDYSPELETMAGEYIRLIKAVQPNGPYFLGGYSLGGAVAFEMARQLIRNGEEVGFLGQIDSGLFPDEDPIGSEIREYIGFARGYAGLALSPEELAEVPESCRMDYVLQRIKDKVSGLDYSLAARVAPVFLANKRALQRYLTKIFADPQSYLYDGLITLFKAADPAGTHLPEQKQPPSIWSTNPFGNWDKFSLGSPQIRSVSGNHRTCIHEPHVEMLAHELLLALQQAEASIS